MKAIIEIDLPESCYDCPLNQADIYDENFWCRLTDVDVSEETENRHYSCPLKIIKGVENDDNQNQE